MPEYQVWKVEDGDAHRPVPVWWEHLDAPEPREVEGGARRPDARCRGRGARPVRTAWRTLWAVPPSGRLPRRSSTLSSVRLASSAGSGPRSPLFGRVSSRTRPPSVAMPCQLPRGPSPFQPLRLFQELPAVRSCRSASAIPLDRLDIAVRGARVAERPHPSLELVVDLRADAGAVEGERRERRQLHEASGKQSGEALVVDDRKALQGADVPEFGRQRPAEVVAVEGRDP